MWHDAALVAGKDLRIEARSRVTTNQVVPFALLVLVVFAFALDPDRGFLARAAPGLFWVAVLLAGLLAVQRSFAVESSESARDALRLSGLDPAAMFLGKAGVGKHKFARALEKELFTQGKSAYMLDGTNILLGVDADTAETLPEPSGNPGEIEVGPDDVVPDEKRDKLRRAWDRISGKQ